MATLNWRIEHDNEVGIGDESLAEWWTVTNGTLDFRASSAADAERLVTLLRDLPEYDVPAPDPNSFRSGTLVMDGPRIGVFVKPLDQGRVLVQFSGPLPECVREAELTLLSDELKKAFVRLRDEAEYAEARSVVEYARMELLDLGLL